MARIIPNIIFNVQSHKYYSSSERSKINNLPDGKEKNALSARVTESDFYHSHSSSFDILEYLSRKNAIEGTTLDDAQKIQEMISYADANTADILGYASARPGSTGLWNEAGDIYDLKEIRSSLRETESVVWHSVISFKQEYGLKNVGNKKVAHELIKNTIGSLFDGAKLNTSNMDWYAAFHTNTDNPHIHLIFWEKKADRLSSSSEVSHTPYFLPKEAIINYKTTLAKYLDNRKTFYPLRDETKNSFLSSLKITPYYHELQKLKKILDNSNSTQFSRLSNETKKFIGDLTFKIIKDKPKLKKIYNNYSESLKKEQVSMINNYIENKVKVPSNVKNFYTNRIDDINLRLFNSLIKYVQTEELPISNKKTKSKLEQTSKNLQLASRSERRNSKNKTAGIVLNITNTMNAIINDEQNDLKLSAQYYYEKNKIEGDFEQ